MESQQRGSNIDMLALLQKGADKQKVVMVVEKEGVLYHSLS